MHSRACHSRVYNTHAYFTLKFTHIRMCCTHEFTRIYSRLALCIKSVHTFGHIFRQLLSASFPIATCMYLHGGIRKIKTVRYCLKYLGITRYPVLSLTLKFSICSYSKHFKMYLTSHNLSGSTHLLAPSMQVAWNYTKKYTC